MAINDTVRYINTSVIAGKKPAFLSTILERYKQIYVAEEDVSKDVESYSAQSFTKKLRTFFNEQQLNIYANETKKNCCLESWTNALRTCNRACQG